ncbi:MAG: MBL fold metallo-hydrolase [Defluviitaleaceae bacterium]|nr:MBL fold metallo-hydrolase [Defluviitaleaceae bacterium]
MIQSILPHLYRIEIPLPNSPLKTLNSYIMTSNDRHLIVDTGFNMPECLETMRNAIEILGLDMTKTDILATHLHADHNGLISQIMSETSDVYMGRIDREIFLRIMTDGDTYWQVAEARYEQEGYPSEEMAQTRLWNPARKFVSSGVFEITALDDGDVVRCGGLQWQVMLTPGHTPGHICLYEPHHRILIAGDHVLFDITPNITWWHDSRDALGDYLTSLERISTLKVALTLTGHRGNEGNFHERVKALQRHHADRLQDVLELVKEQPGISGYEIASKMTWSIRSNWTDFPPGQRWFAVGEAISHLDHLVLLRKLQRHHVNGIHTYRCR